MTKTNAIRLLEANHIPYIERTYDENLTDAQEVAKACNQKPERVFKTLVLIGSDKKHYVAIIPSTMVLDLKKMAKVANVKSIEMIKAKELLPLTGYVHGGCSPIGMKKFFKTYIDESALLYDSICISGGKRGIQVEISVKELLKFIEIVPVDICTSSK